MQKIFICHALGSSNATLLNHFVNTFRRQKWEYEILVDTDTRSGNFHERFEGWANECDIALVLVSNSIFSKDSYPNRVELPILLKRQKKGQVKIIGVHLDYSDSKDLVNWNSAGDISFFQFKFCQSTHSASFNDPNGYALYSSFKQVGVEVEFVTRLRDCIRDNSVEQYQTANHPKQPSFSNSYDNPKFDKRTPTLFDCLCCNRQEQWEIISKFISDNQNNPGHYRILLPSTGKDMPESFVTRIIHGLLNENDFEYDDKYKNQSESKLRLVADRIGSQVELDAKKIEIKKYFSSVKDPNKWHVFFHHYNVNPSKINYCSEFLDKFLKSKVCESLDSYKILNFIWLDFDEKVTYKGNFFQKLFKKQQTVDLSFFANACKDMHTINFLPKLGEITEVDVRNWFTKFSTDFDFVDYFIKTHFPTDEGAHFYKIEQALENLIPKSNSSYLKK